MYSMYICIYVYMYVFVCVINLYMFIGVQYLLYSFASIVYRIHCIEAILQLFIRSYIWISSQPISSQGGP